MRTNCSSVTVARPCREHITSFEERVKQGEKFSDADGDLALASAAKTLREVEKKAHRQKYDKVLSR